MTDPKDFGRRSFLTWPKGLRERNRDAETKENLQMREIKFRAWDKKENHYRQDGEFWYRHGKWIYFIHHYDIENEYLPVPDRIEMEQYTSFKDKTGIEIYKSDRIEGNLFDRRIPTMGEVVYDNEHAQYGSKNEVGITPLYKIAEIEIIGNIHQPEEQKDG